MSENWSLYTLYDFTETVCHTEIGTQIGGAENVEKVLAAWGNGSNEIGGEWSGGFLMKLRDGRIAYAEGWCDFTGWGCRDGATVTFFDSVPNLKGLSKDHDDIEWDKEPADLNGWIERGYPEDEEFA